MNKILEKLGQYGIVPVVVLNDSKDAEPLADALCEGGLACAEVTFRTEAAAESIRIMSEKHPEMLVGAGTVLTIEQVDEAVAAGAKFIVSPGLNPEIVKYCLEKNIAVTPGVVTPSEMAQAVELGLPLVKFFPAGAIRWSSYDPCGCCCIHNIKIHANWRNQPKQCQRLLKRRQDLCLRWKLDGQRKSCRCRRL